MEGPKIQKIDADGTVDFGKPIVNPKTLPKNVQFEEAKALAEHCMEHYDCGLALLYLLRYHPKEKK